MIDLLFYTILSYGSISKKEKRSDRSQSEFFSIYQASCDTSKKAMPECVA
jgi:hypothetical protein